MDRKEIKEKVLQGGKLAIEKMLERKIKENAFVVISVNGKVVTLPAKDVQR